MSNPARTELNDFSEKILKLNDECRDSLARASDMIEIAPVILPLGENLLGVNDHYGWPVAVMAGKTLVVITHRIPQHWNCRPDERDEPDKYTSRAVVLRSQDGGTTWSELFDLRECIKTPTEDCKLCFGNSIGLDGKGRVVVVTAYGVFSSADEGATWEHLSGAFGAEQLPGPRTNNGPVLILHPRHGLVAAGHSMDSGRKNPDGTQYYPPELWLRTSADDGRTWKEEKVDLSEFATAIEPTMLLHDGRLLVVARCHGVGCQEPDLNTWRYVQLWSHDDWAPLEAKLTNIRTRGGPTGSHGPSSQDTVDLSFNPVTQRLEVIATNRNGGGPGREQEKIQTLNLWSIAPESFETAEWRFETTLLTRDGRMYVDNRDGMHPGGAVIDEERGVQHIFIYAGQGEGPTGVFRIDRTLNTVELAEALG